MSSSCPATSIIGLKNIIEASIDCKLTAERSKSSSIPLAPGQQLLTPRKKRKLSATQSVPTAAGHSEGDKNVTIQEVDPQGGELQNGY